MKKQLLLLSILMCALTYTACSSDDDNQNGNESCNCYYTLIEGSQLQEGYIEPSDTTDCNLDGVHVYFEDYMNGEPNDIYYRVLHCEASQ